ncbi:paraquat-inducible protein A [Thalassotalea agarivorans]|uniref:Paraquat-inducible protein A n=1 Tax=Thalassotalea agarivorans TaxID=349064 RepID=A0A1I0CVN3_THASX|nr:paraquat-inducible protein A [Thalassotalea agarivorans]SET23812.1 paraquat-inducible protein A [Thalassotalea agarivorans]
MSSHVRTAKQHGLGNCPKCLKLNRMMGAKQKCTRCGAYFYIRKPKAMQYTLAWTIAAIVTLFPANLLPMMVFNKVGSGDPSNIMGGIIKLVEMGMLPIAIVVFIASFVVPIAKITGLLILVFTAKYKTKVQPKTRAKIYEIVEFLGPWSMLDVFVVALMVAVVNLGFVTSIEAGAGSTYFTLAVIFTMFASQSFEPRSIWDEEEYDRAG